MDIEALKGWIGRREVLEDRLGLFPPAALSATLDRQDAAPAEGDVLPALWHWLYFLPRARQGEIGADGHPKRGGFLPPVALPRRMWAGGRLSFAAPLRLGEAVRRVSTIADVSAKSGRSGTLVFVLVRHEVFGPGGLAVTEEHDIVYRDAPRGGEGAGEVAAVPQQAAEHSAWRRDIVADDVLLFRYSALTFNGHRIHYDRRYVTGVEGYPGLIVHGPLLATLLMDLFRRHDGRAVAGFRFRALAPVFDTTAFSVHGEATAEGARLWVRRADGALCMEATVAAG